MNEKETSYPLHEKMAYYKEPLENIREFLEWLLNEKKPAITLCHVIDDDDHPFSPIITSDLYLNKLLLEYFGVDYEAFHEEKDNMLTEIREAQKEKE